MLPSRDNRQRSPLALLSILLAVFLCGFFWLWQRHSIQMETSPVVPPSPTPSSTTPSPSSAEDLEASAVNIPIPDFESVF